MNEFKAESVKTFYAFLKHQRYTEMRIIDPRGGLKEVSFVDDLTDFLATCEKYNGKANVYVGVNERTTKEGKAENVGKLSIIPLDVDPVRPKGEASTDAELELARQKMLQIKSWLKENLDCSPFITMSGNGFHIFIKIPTITLDEFNRPVIQQKLESFVHQIQEKFNDDRVRIDSTFDLPRVMKCPGTMSVKGDNTPERPRRMCQIVESNDLPCTGVLNHLVELKTGEKAEFKLGEKTEKEFTALLEKDEKLKDLFEGDWKKYGYTSRSEAEQALLTKLIVGDLSKEAINIIMSRCRIGKWGEKKEAYRERSIQKALEFIKKRKEGLEPKKTEFSWEEIGDSLTFEEWQRIIIDNFTELWPYAEACASTIGVLLIKDAQPLALVLQECQDQERPRLLTFSRNSRFHTPQTSLRREPSSRT